MRWWSFVLWAAVVGCDVDDLDSGTAVGNPGDMDVSSTRVPAAITLDRMFVEVAAVALERCGGGAVPVVQHVTLDALAMSFAPARLPGGQYCGLQLELAAPVRIEGRTSLNREFIVWVDLNGIGVAGPFNIDGDALVVGIPILLDADALNDLGDGAVVEADSDLAMAVADAVRDAVLLARDDDLDGRLGVNDTVLVSPGFSGAAALQADAQAASGCGGGCATSGPPAGLWTLFKRTRRVRCG